jgi:pyruvate/2-oxoglutarate dehydrogenase complex dihydrolipoamide dehydrogenase (E3) component
VRPNWAPVAKRIRDEATDNWSDMAAVKRFEEKGGEFVRGRGKLDGPGIVTTEDSRFHARRAVVLATGARATIPPIPGLASTPFWTNHELVEAKELPESLIVIGGGAIGAELSQVLARFGVSVTIVDTVSRLLNIEEPEVDAVVRKAFERDHIEVVTDAQTTKVSYTNLRFTVTLEDGRTVSAERLMVATGRTPDLTQLGLETVGVDISGKFVPTDETLRVTGNLWAVGDITGHGAFTHVAMYQSAIATAAILGQPFVPANYSAVPRVTFTDPEVGSVGLSEAAATQLGLDIQIGVAEVTSTTRGWIHNVDNAGFIKVVADMNKNILVGATAVGPHGGEVLGLLTLAVHQQTPIETLSSMMYAYPTFHRGVSEALAQLKLV